MSFEALEDKRMYQRAEKVADQTWDFVIGWKWFEKRTVGSQLTNAMDSIGANIAEAGGRFHPGDVIRFLYFARGSLTESKYWLRRCRTRHLVAEEILLPIEEDLGHLHKEINQAIKFQCQRQNPSPEPPNHLTTQPPNHPTT
jgi:four helix bundle protein